MQIPVDIVTIAWALGLVAQIASIWRISQADLGKTFSWFRIYLIASLASSLLQMYSRGIAKNALVYGAIYIGWAYLATVFQFFALRELTFVALKPFPALQEASRKTLTVFWIVVIFAGLGWYYYLSQIAVDHSPILRAAIRYQAVASIGFAVFVFLFLTFLAWMPVPLSRNQLNHCFLVGALFLLSGVSRVLTEFGAYQDTIMVANLVGLFGACLLYALWAVRIRPGPDDTLNTPKGRVEREDAEEMLARLEQLNRSIGKLQPGQVAPPNRFN